MIRTSVLAVLACLALSSNAFAANTSTNLEKSFLVAEHHMDSHSSDSKSDDKSKDDSSSDDKSHDDKSDDDKSHDSHS